MPPSLNRRQPTKRVCAPRFQHYLNGHATGNSEEFRKAFHPRPDDVRARRQAGDHSHQRVHRPLHRQPGGDEALRKRRITSVEITGSVTVGRIELDYPSAFLVDYMTLLKDDGRWVIIAKSFNSAPKSR